MRFSILFPVVALAVLVSGHAADEDLSHLSARQLAEHQAGIQRRELAARACAPQIAAFERRRIVARDNLMRRQAPPPPPPVCPPCPPCGQGFGAPGAQAFGPPGGFPSGVPASALSGAPASAPSGSPASLPSGSQGSMPPQGSAAPTGQASAPPGTQGSGTTSTHASGTTTTGSAQVSASVTPHYTSIQNSTCVLHPEVTEGPYYIRNEFLRNDLREDQDGTTLILDIGVIDSTTCQPFSNALVEIWSANATGSYGGYSGMQGSPDTVHVDTFLRGGFYTNDQGIVELKTIYPGFYTGRTAHIHTMVHKGWTSRDNGTFVSDSGSLTHIGQFFFEDSISDTVFATSPYTSNTQTRSRNSEDNILSSAGDNAYVSLTQLGDSEYLGYITVVVDGSATYSITNSNELR